MTVVPLMDVVIAFSPYGLFLEKNIPGAVRRHIMDAGHFAPLEKPQEVNAAISAFLDANGL